MRRHTRLIAMLAVLAVLIAVGFGIWGLWPCTAINRENAAKIRVGMTLAEVEAILGGPARHESTGPVVLDEFGQRRHEWRFVMVHAGLRFGDSPPHWQSDYVAIMVQLDPERRVIGVSVAPLRRDRGGPVDLYRWVGL
jgi:hypothetical protein